MPHSSQVAKRGKAEMAATARRPRVEVSARSTRCQAARGEHLAALNPTDPFKLTPAAVSR